VNQDWLIANEERVNVLDRQVVDVRRRIMQSNRLHRHGPAVRHQEMVALLKLDGPFELVFCLAPRTDGCT
jgi:hypothetical protein